MKRFFTRWFKILAAWRSAACPSARTLLPSGRCPRKKTFSHRLQQRGFQSIAPMLSILLLCLGLLAGCGASEEDAVRQATSDFLAASNKGDRAAFISHMTKAAQSQMQTPAGKDVKISQNSATAYTVGKPIVAGTAAEVSVSSKDKQGKPIEATVELTREDSAWKVRAMQWTLSNGTSFRVDFEHPETIGGEMIRAMQGSRE
jgi:hypothetical protein